LLNPGDEQTAATTAATTATTNFYAESKLMNALIAKELARRLIEERNTSNQVSISSTFYVRIFRTNVVLAAFL